MSHRPVLEIKVSKTTHCNNLAASIVNAYTQGKNIVLSAIGPVPVSQAYKATAIANRALVSRGIVLCIMPTMVMKDMPALEPPHEPVPWVVARMRLINMMEESPVHRMFADEQEEAPFVPYEEPANVA